jgi:hypothetical protein
VKSSRFAPFLVAAVATTMVAACAHTDASAAFTDAPASTASALDAVRDPISLVGTWQVTGSTVATGTTLILGTQLLLFQDCGLTEGTWEADAAGQFVGDTDGSDSECVSTLTQGPTWLRAAARFQQQGADRILVDNRGQALARLSPGAQPIIGPNDAASLAAPPVLTTALRMLLTAPAPLPPTLLPLTSATVTGRWIPSAAARGNAKAYVEFRADKSWTSSDGCNNTDGRFAVGPAGQLLTTSGPATAVACNNSPVSRWTTAARRIAFDGRTLVFLDADSRIIGRCVRA